jgi:hypothetical protein
LPTFASGRKKSRRRDIMLGIVIATLNYYYAEIYKNRSRLLCFRKYYLIRSAHNYTHVYK